MGESKLENKINDEKQKVVETTSASQEADARATNTTNEVKAATATAAEAKANVTKDKHAENDRKEAKKESREIKADAQATEDEARQASNDAEKAAAATNDVQNTPLPESIGNVEAATNATVVSSAASLSNALRRLFG